MNNVQKLRSVFIVLLMMVLIVGGIACSKKEEANHDLDERQITEDHDKQAVKADHEPPTTNTPDPNAPGTTAPFWKVNHNGNVVYLLGSIHVAKEDLYPLHGIIEAAFAESDYLAVEADILNMDIFAVQKELDKRAKYSDGTTLKDHINPFLYAKLKKEFKEMRLNLRMFEAYEPWYISMLLDQLKIMQLGYDADLGVDQHFLKLANGNKEIIELEGMEFQLDLMDGFSEEIQLAQLHGSIMQANKYEEDIEKLFAAWKSADDEAMKIMVKEPEGLRAEEKEMYREYNVAMLDQRNVGMVDKIEGFLNGNKKETYFVVVGAAHYVGDMGIVGLLEERGYTVEKQVWSK